MAVFPCDLTCSFLLYRTSQLKGQKGDFLFIIQPRRTAEASGIPMRMIQVVTCIEKLEELHAPEITHGLHGGAFHFHADGAHFLSSGNFAAGLPVESICGPCGACNIWISASVQHFLEQLHMAFVHINAIPGRSIVA